MDAPRDAATVVLRRLRHEDLPLVSRWLREPRVARWWAEDPSPAAVEARYGPSTDATDGTDGTDATEVFVASAETAQGWREFGLDQRYRFTDEAAYAAGLSAVLPVPEGAVSIDHLVGESDLQGRGLGPAMIAAVVAGAWVRWPGAREVLVPVAAGNRASWRALEAAGFVRVAEGPLEPDDPVDPPDHVVHRLARPRWARPPAAERRPDLTGDPLPT